MLRTRYFSLILFVWACHSFMANFASYGQAPGAIAYELELLPGPAVQVTLQIKSTSESTLLELENEWGGVTNDGSDVNDLSGEDLEGKQCKIEQVDSTHWRVSHPKNSALKVRYTIARKSKPDAIPGNDYRTKLDEQYFQMIGHLGLLAPKTTEDSTTVDIRIIFRGFQAKGWNVVSSFGNGEGPFQYHGDISGFLHSVILAGKLRVEIASVEKNEIGVAMVGDDWNFQPTELRDVIQKIVQAERDFFNDHTDPWFLVTLTPIEQSSPNAVSLGGTALRNAFSLFCTKNFSVAPNSERPLDGLRLLAHEYFHTWNGIKIPTAGDDPSTYWFSEGFTNFYARRILLRAGLISADQFTEELNTALRNYDGNPWKTENNQRIKEAFWSNRNAQDLPYHRGELLALLIDEKIASASNGKKSLDDLMIDLLNHPMTELPVSTEMLFARLAAWVDAETLSHVREVVLDGKEIELPKTLRDPKLRLARGKMQTFEIGFDFEASREAKKILGVNENSNAYAAGVRNDQLLRGFSVDSAGNPPHAKLIIVVDGKQKEIEYDALSPPKEVRLFGTPSLTQ